MRFALIGTFTLTLVTTGHAAGHLDQPRAAASFPAAFEFVDPCRSTPPQETLRIPVALNESVESYVEDFRTEKITFQQGLNNAAPYLGLMKEIFKSESLPPELLYIVMIESRFNHAAVSPAQAVGPWQFMAATGDEYSLINDTWVDERKDLIKSTFAAARYLKDLHGRLGSWPLVLAAYNGGISKVRRAMASTGSEDFWELSKSDHLARETKSFVPKIMAAFIISRNPGLYGFAVPVAPPLRFDVVVTDRSLDLYMVASALDTSYGVIKSLNPEIKGRNTPPRAYALRIPAGTRSLFLARTASARSAARTDALSYGFPLLTHALVSDELSGGFKLIPAERHDKPVARRNYDSVFFIKTGRQKKKSRGKIIDDTVQEPGPSG